MIKLHEYGSHMCSDKSIRKASKSGFSPVNRPSLDKPGMMLALQKAKTLKFSPIKSGYLHVVDSVSGTDTVEQRVSVPSGGDLLEQASFVLASISGTPTGQPNGNKEPSHYRFQPHRVPPAPRSGSFVRPQIESIVNPFGKEFPGILVLGTSGSSQEMELGFYFTDRDNGSLRN